MYIDKIPEVAKTWVGYRLNCIDSDSFRFQCDLMMISNIYPVSLFSKTFIGAEYHEKKSTGYIKTGLFKSCLCKIELHDSG